MGGARLNNSPLSSEYLEGCGRRGSGGAIVVMVDVKCVCVGGEGVQFIEGGVEVSFCRVQKGSEGLSHRKSK